MAFRYDPPFEAHHIKLDLFPALVSQLDGDILTQSTRLTAEGNDNRVIVTDSHLYVFRDGSEAPDAYIVEPITAFLGTTKDGYKVAVEDGSVYHVIRAVSCGCGSRLRGFHPFPGIPYVRMD